MKLQSFICFICFTKAFQGLTKFYLVLPSFTLSFPLLSPAFRAKALVSLTSEYASEYASEQDSPNRRNRLIDASFDGFREARDEVIDSRFFRSLATPPATGTVDSKHVSGQSASTMRITAIVSKRFD